MGAILRADGWDVFGNWPDMEQALSALEQSGAQLLILSKRLIEPPDADSPAKLLDGIYSGKIIIVLEPGEEFSSSEFVELDVEGLILSSASRDELNECVDSISKGHQWIDPGIRRVLAIDRQPIPNWSELSSRELEVAQLATLGLSNKEIARQLQVSDGTVKMHMHHVLTKLHLASRTDLIWSFPEFFNHAEAEQRQRKILLESRGASPLGE